MKREKMAYRLKKELDAARYAHTLGVEKTAREMAEKFGVDEEKAALAGLLHDCAKCMPLSQMTKAAKNEKLDPVMKESKALMHAVAGAHVAQDVYDVHDPEVLGAIRWHTTGHANMTKLETKALSGAGGAQKALHDRFGRGDAHGAADEP